MAVNALSVEHAVYDALSVVKRLSLKTASVVVISHSKLNLYQYASVCTRVINTHSILGKRRMHLYDWGYDLHPCNNTQRRSRDENLKLDYMHITRLQFTNGAPFWKRAEKKTFFAYSNFRRWPRYWAAAYYTSSPVACFGWNGLSSSGFAQSILDTALHSATACPILVGQKSNAENFRLRQMRRAFWR